jgi:hypothetical protein
VFAQDRGSKEQVLWVVVKEQYADGIFNQVQNLPSRSPIFWSCRALRLK